MLKVENQAVLVVSYNLEYIYIFDNFISGRKKQLVQLARKYDLLLISDDVYNFLCYNSPESNDPETARAPKRIYAYDDKKDPGYKGRVYAPLYNHGFIVA